MQKVGGREEKGCHPGLRPKIAWRDWESKHEILKRKEEIAQREGDAIILEDLHRKGLIDSEEHILQNFME